ncbi:MAG: hypothetical protein ACE5GL_09460, partial [Calditrichia bacterium]
KEHGGAREVKGVEETAQVLGKLFSDEGFRNRTGKAAAPVVFENTGATEKTVAVVATFLETSEGKPV